MSDIFGAGNQKDARVGPTEMPTVLGTLVTVAEPLLFKGVVLANRTAGDLTAIVHVVPVGGVAANGTQVVPNAVVPTHDSIVLEFGRDGIPLILGDSVQMVASGLGINIVAIFSRRNR